MATTTTPHFSWTVENPSGNLYYKVAYRVSGTTPFIQFNTSGMTAAIPGLLPNILYDFQVTNVNNLTNPVSPLVQSANITDPMPTISPVNNAITLSWTNLSADITGYTTTIALTSNPTVILATHNPSIAGTITDTFTGLSSLTSYRITITPAIGSISTTFSYTASTTATSLCPAPINVTVTLM